MTRNPTQAIATYQRNPGARACTGSNTTQFYPHPADTKAVAAAQTICAACAVRPGCLEYALKHRIADGIWGGVTEQGRETILRHRNHQPPTTTQLILNQLDHHNPTSTADLAERLNLPRRLITNNINDLRRRGLVARHTNSRGGPGTQGSTWLLATHTEAS